MSFACLLDLLYLSVPHCHLFPLRSNVLSSSSSPCQLVSAQLADCCVNLWKSCALAKFVEGYLNICYCLSFFFQILYFMHEFVVRCHYQCLHIFCLSLILFHVLVHFSRYELKLDNTIAECFFPLYFVCKESTRVQTLVHSLPQVLYPIHLSPPKRHLSETHMLHIFFLILQVFCPHLAAQ